jgi:GDPmannose 4,6-dehydratase
MYGDTIETPQSEKTVFKPASPYAAAKLYAHWITANYRSSYGIFASNGILFNHESPVRGETFVTRKITRALTRIQVGLQEKLYLGNLDAKRDWGFAGDYVEAMWKMLQRDQPKDFVIATGQTHSVKEFVQQAFEVAGLDWQQYVKTDERYMRPAEVDLLLGGAAEAKKDLAWTPKVDFKNLVRMMVEADLQLVAKAGPKRAYFA